MKLRDHPLMTREGGIVSWPPEWQSVGRSGGAIRGELGILDNVSMSDVIANKIFLAMEHLTERYIAVIAFDNELFTKQLYPLLIQNIGNSVREIGDLDLSHLL